VNKRFLLRVLLACLALLAFAYVGRRYSHELPRLLDAKPLGVALIVVVFIPTRVLTSEVMRIGLKALGHRISTYESFMVSLVNAYANLLFPRAGLGLPAVYMKMKHAIPIADFATVQLLPMTVLQVTTIGITGVACLFGMRLAQGRPLDWKLACLFAGVAVASVVAISFRFNVPDRWGNRVAAFLRRLSESWRLLGRCRHTASRSFALHFAVLLLRGLRLQIAFWAIGQPVHYLAALAASLLADLAFFISITPSALGFREGAVVLAAGMLGTTKEICLAAVLLDRIVYSIVIVVVAQVGMLQFMRPVFRQSPISVAPAPGGPSTSPPSAPATAPPPAASS
jgi:uncharacterized membrane protein YbhN (UPF0104 family)